MKVQINDPKGFANTVSWVAKALPSRPSVPVLAGIRITAADGMVSVAGYDYEVSTESGMDAAVDEPGVALVSGRLLAEITKALPAKPITLTAVGAHLELVCGSGRFTLPTMPVEDYPALPDMPPTAGTVDAAVWAHAVAQVAVAAGRDETLPMMTGIRLESTGGTLRLMATDRYRLAVRDVTWMPGDDQTLTALIPHATLATAAKTLAGSEPVQIAHQQGNAGEGTIGFAAGQSRLTSRLLDGANYPPVMSLFPDADKVTGHATVQVADLVEVVKRVALVAERTTPVLLSFSADGLVVEAGGTEEARASEAMQATHDGPDLTIGFNPQYLLDGLQALGTSTVRFAFVDSFKPAVLHPVDADGEIDPAYRYLIMPIRVTR
jgi:DNA polymerase-3 subunit beta